MFLPALEIDPNKIYYFSQVKVGTIFVFRSQFDNREKLGGNVPLFYKSGRLSYVSFSDYLQKVHPIVESSDIAVLVCTPLSVVQIDE